MRVGVDIDDVLYPWADTAHMLCERAGITNGASITQWKFHKDYGCTEAEVWEVLGHGTETGELYLQPPYPGVAYQLRRLQAADHTVHLCTARGFRGELAPMVRALTLWWLNDNSIPHDSMTFSEDKRVLGADVFIDDSLRNYDALEGAGVAVWLQDRTHNQVPGCTRQRVESLTEFVDLVLAAEEDS